MAQVDITYTKATGGPIVVTFTYRRPEADWSATGELVKGESDLAVSSGVKG